MKGELKSLIKGRVSFDVSMAKHTSLRVGGSADVLVFPRDEHDLREILRFARERAIPYYILGKGTNVIVRDGGLRGIVISLCRGFRRLTILGRRDQGRRGYHPFTGWRVQYREVRADQVHRR